LPRSDGPFPPGAVTITDDENGLLAHVVLPICCPNRRRRRDLAILRVPRS
jgi:hypothetical protein